MYFVARQALSATPCVALITSRAERARRCSVIDLALIYVANTSHADTSGLLELRRRGDSGHRGHHGAAAKRSMWCVVEKVCGLLEVALIETQLVNDFVFRKIKEN